MGNETHSDPAQHNKKIIIRFGFGFGFNINDASACGYNLQCPFSPWTQTIGLVLTFRHFFPFSIQYKKTYNTDCDHQITSDDVIKFRASSIQWQPETPAFSLFLSSPEMELLNIDEKLSENLPFQIISSNHAARRKHPRTKLLTCEYETFQNVWGTLYRKSDLCIPRNETARPRS